MLKALSDSLRSASRFQGLILRGAGKAFCAGADLQDVDITDSTSQERVLKYLHKLVGQLNFVIELLTKLAVPTVALLHGNVAGGGFGLALAAKNRITATNLRLHAGPGLLGLVPAGGCTYALPRLLGDSAARKLLLSDQQIEAQEALQLGLVDEIVPLEWIQRSPRELIDWIFKSKAFQGSQRF
jgi:enoyl-CoA hydratase/carnithine racemase